MLKKPDKKQLGWMMLFLMGSLIPMFALMLRKGRPRQPDEFGLTPVPASASSSAPAPASASASASSSASK
ncbi:MAG: hypothetical protein ACXVEF_24880 [Polyangiales bacterium]